MDQMTGYMMVFMLPVLLDVKIQRQTAALDIDFMTLMSRTAELNPLQMALLFAMRKPLQLLLILPQKQ